MVPFIQAFSCIMQVDRSFTFTIQLLHPWLCGVVGSLHLARADAMPEQVQMQMRKWQLLGRGRLPEQVQTRMQMRKS